MGFMVTLDGPQTICPCPARKVLILVSVMTSCGASAYMVLMLANVRTLCVKLSPAHKVLMLASFKILTAVSHRSDEG